jgi:hypothetical protein
VGIYRKLAVLSVDFFVDERGRMWVNVGISSSSTRTDFGRKWAFLGLISGLSTRCVQMKNRFSMGLRYLSVGVSSAGVLVGSVYATKDRVRAPRWFPCTEGNFLPY